MENRAEKMEQIVLDSSGDEWSSSGEEKVVYATSSSTNPDEFSLPRIHKSKKISSAQAERLHTVEEIYDPPISLKSTTINSGTWPVLEKTWWKKLKGKVHGVCCPVNQPLPVCGFILLTIFVGLPCLLLLLVSIGCIFTGMHCLDKSQHDFFGEVSPCVLLGIVFSSIAVFIGSMTYAIVDHCGSKASPPNEER